MISVVGDEQVYTYARFLNGIQDGEGTKFLYSYYDKKYGDALLSRHIYCVYRGGAFVLQFRDLKALIELEDILDIINNLFVRFFHTYELSKNFKVNSLAEDIRVLERDVSSIMWDLYNAFKLKDIYSMLQILKTHFPKGKESILEKKMLTLMAHYEKNGSLINSKGIANLVDFLSDVDFTNSRASKCFVVKV